MGARSRAFDAVVIGAGFAGLYMVYRLRESGFSVHGFEAGSSVGGTWYWNRYPGARCDSESMYYSYSFLPDLEQAWPLEERYPRQPMILKYLETVAERLDLFKEFTFNARVNSAVYDEGTERWTVRATGAPEASAKFVVTAVGGLSAANIPKYPGAETFAGDVYSTANWPHQPVSFTGKKVALFGTGSSGVQAIPEIAKQAEHLTVFQRTPQYVAPARGGPLDPQFVQLWKSNYQEIRRRTKWTAAGIPYPEPQQSALDLSPEERRAICEEAWRRGGIFFLDGTFSDAVTNLEANTVVADFVRSKIDEIVHDPETARKLKPTTYAWGTKRHPVGTDFYETFNRSNVSLVDLRSDPIEEITPAGIRTSTGDHAFDAIIYATGFDALTGAITALNVRGRADRSLAASWSEGPRTYLGLMAPGFPNLFMICGPGSPSVVTNVPAAIEQHVEWIADLLCHMRLHGRDSIEATEDSTAEWIRHVQDLANETLYPTTDSWYMGANIPGKPRVFLPYIGGLHVYRKRCDEIAAAGYPGFTLTVTEGVPHGVG